LDDVKDVQNVHRRPNPRTTTTKKIVGVIAMTAGSLRNRTGRDMARSFRS
jgi:hypothetical protein